MIVHVIVSGTTIHQSPHSVGRCDHNAISPEDVGRAHCDIMDACLNAVESGILAQCHKDLVCWPICRPL